MAELVDRSLLLFALSLDTFLALALLFSACNNGIGSQPLHASPVGCRQPASGLSRPRQTGHSLTEQGLVCHREHEAISTSA